VPDQPVTGGTLALRGRVVTMDPQRSVVDDGVVYVAAGRVVDVRPSSATAPDGFAAVPVVASRGTVFPGLVELHNHLPYDVLPLWQVPRAYGDRDQWSGPGNPDYHRLVTGPMQVLGARADATAAVVRFVEVRCLLGGTTTSQGVTLATSPGMVTHFRGLVRNVERTDDPELPPAQTHIADVDATDAARFLARLSQPRKLILHLAEGVDDAAHRHFAALQVSPGTWAITGNLVAIHCVALTDADFAILSANGGSMVWSPLSNLLLYGRTADVGAALRRKVPVALGSDWAPSGSKNLLGELKVARMYAAAQGLALSSADLVAMATSTPAAMLGWGTQVGSVVAGRRADLVVVAGRTEDPYEALLAATEADVRLVTVEGVPRFGTPALLAALGAAAGTERVRVAGRSRLVNLVEPAADPLVARLSVREATQVLRTALHDLPTASGRGAPAARLPGGQVRLAVDGLVDNGMTPRPHLPLNGVATGPNFRPPGAARMLATAPVVLPSLRLDPLTAVDNAGYYDELAAETNLPPEIRTRLAGLRP
jgi:cytosine/adenosine deaminase-related metal-dependent hydrolase